MLTVRCTSKCRHNNNARVRKPLSIRHLILSDVICFKSVQCLLSSKVSITAHGILLKNKTGKKVHFNEE